LPENHSPENRSPHNYPPESHLPDHGASAPPRSARRRRYARSPSQAVLTPLTPVRVEMLRFLAELRFLSLPQIARLCCPAARQDLSEKRARRHMRALFDGGLVDVLPVSRAALSPPGAPNDASLLYGSAPNVYAPTARALETLHQSGLVDNQGAGRMKPGYGPKNSLFLAHELGVRDVRVWLELAARRHGDQAVKEWHDGPEAAIDLGRTQAPKTLRPDAWFVYRLGEREGRDLVLVGFCRVRPGDGAGRAALVGEAGCLPFPVLRPPAARDHGVRPGAGPGRLPDGCQTPEPRGPDRPESRAAGGGPVLAGRECAAGSARAALIYVAEAGKPGAPAPGIGRPGSASLMRRDLKAECSYLPPRRQGNGRATVSIRRFTWVCGREIIKN